jgi:hypothetical protein
VRICEGAIESVHDGGAGVGLTTERDVNPCISREHGHRPAAWPRRTTLVDDGVFFITRPADGFAKAAFVGPYIVNVTVRPGYRPYWLLCCGRHPNGATKGSQESNKASERVESRASANDHGYGSEIVTSPQLTCRSLDSGVEIEAILPCETKQVFTSADTDQQKRIFFKLTAVDEGVCAKYRRGRA